MKIVWSDVAEADLDDIYDYIARDVPYYAEQFTDTLIEAVGALAEHPRLGRPVPEAQERDDVREFLSQLPRHLPHPTRPGKRRKGARLESPPNFLANSPKHQGSLRELSRL